MDVFSAGAMIAGKYRLERALARGGMGSVWAAFDTALEVPVALKFMVPSLAASGDLVARFEREAKAAAQLRSPHVVQVFEHGVDRGVPYIVMERLEGEDLGTRLQKRGRLTLWEAAVILEQVCKALRKAHDAGIVHRDLKPGNIFLARHDEDEVIKVLDFGIAKSGSSSASGHGTRTGVVMGSPSYMSPEQVRSAKAVDHRSDLWSLGLVMFRVVTGKLAFAGETDADTIVRLCADPVPVPSHLAPDLPPEIDAWFAQALSRNLDGRFQSAREMAAAFSRIVGRVPSLAEKTDPSASGARGAAGARDQLLPENSAPTASDLARTVKLEGGAPARHAGTLPLQGEPQAEATALLPAEVIGQDHGQPAASTLTNAGSVAAVPSAGSRGWLAWAVAGAAAVAIMTAVVLIPKGPTSVGHVGPASSEGATQPASSGAQPADANAAIDAGAGVDSPSVSAEVPSSVPLAVPSAEPGRSVASAAPSPSGKGPVSTGQRAPKSPPTVNSSPPPAVAPTGDIEIPRVVGGGK